MGVKRYHIYVLIAFLIPTLISLYLAWLCGPIWLEVLVFFLAWIVLFIVEFVLMWKVVMWWNNRKRAKASKVSHQHELRPLLL